MKRFLTLLFLFAAAPVTAQTFAPNDVSILLEAPARPTDPQLSVPQSLISDTLAAEIGAVVSQVNALPGAVAEIDPDLLTERRGQWHVASIRIDPGAPGLSHDFNLFGRNLQVRLVVQPVVFGDGPPIRDEALHLIYSFGHPDPTDVCPLRSIPGPDDIAGFRNLLDDLAALRDDLAALGVETRGAPLGVHPAFKKADAAALLVDRLSTILETRLSEARLSAVSVAGLPPGESEPWVFLAMSRGPDGFAPVPSPAVAQPATADGDMQFQQILSFQVDADNGEVIPPALPRNRLPVDCLANFLFARAGLPMPATDAGISTTPLFAPAGNTPEAAAEVARVVADPAQSHFFNTDCVSCHTETRRELDAAPNTLSAAIQIAEAEDIAREDLPRSPDSMVATFDNWNVRAFGWYPGFPATDKRAHATVTRRVARETADVVACLNRGDWTRTDGPCVDPDKVAFIDQGWSEDTRQRFYHSSQGGAIMPLSWFLALERAESDERFAAPENLARYGLLASTPGTLNPDGLPVGFGVTGTGPDAQVGLNCAACHAGDVIVKGTRLRIDGAPSAFDFDAFTADLADAVRDTGQIDFLNPSGPQPTAKFGRFIETVARTDPELPADFSKQFLDFAAAFTGEMAQRNPAHPSGPGRVDALTQIVNALAVKDLGLPGNLVTPGAPTSYPPLWLTDELEFVQYNLAVADPLTRNIGQALGVFGKTDLKKDLFASSADRGALEAYESWIADLAPPRWPEDILGPIDTTLAERGRDLFVARCEGCHNAPPFRHSAPEENLRGETFIKVTAIPAAATGTDGEYTRAFTQRRVASGSLGEVLGLDKTLPAALYLGAVIKGVTEKALGPDAGGELRLRPVGHPDCGDGSGPCLYRAPLGGTGLKAGPLVGVWATGPYLHNGSVRTVYQVISPPEERETAFFVGSRVLDADALGFVSEPGVGFRFDTTVRGNGNGGHAFWPEPIPPGDRLAIVEYLKDPERFLVER